VRGWVEWWNGTMIDISHPQEMEFLMQRRIHLAARCLTRADHGLSDARGSGASNEKAGREARPS
jgi:hypothetical protein